MIGYLLLFVFASLYGGVILLFLSLLFPHWFQPESIKYPKVIFVVAFVIAIVVFTLLI